MKKQSPPQLKQQPDLAQKLINFCQRRGLVVQSGELYGGLAGFFDFVGYGSQLKRNLEAAWWKRFVESRGDVVGMDGAIITHPKTWEASGHAREFNDPLVECGKCKTKFRADQLVEDELKISVDGLGVEKLQQLISENKIKCEKCGSGLEFVNAFNLMFKTSVGAGAAAAAGAGTGESTEAPAAFLRPETAQLIFTDFKLAQTASRLQPPFGIAQVGKAFRNEISPRNFVFRCREFTQMELEYFVDGRKLDDCPGAEQFEDLKLLVLTAGAQEKKQDDQKNEKNAGGIALTLGECLRKKIVGSRWMAYWLGETLSFLHSLGIKPENLRLRQHVSTELSHYSKETWDVEYAYPWGWKELVGIAYRTDFDLRQHAAASGANLSVFDEESKQSFVPHVIEPSFGLERLFFTVLLDAYSESSSAEGSSIVLRLSPAIAPVQVAVFPLMKKDGLAEKARSVYELLRNNFVAQYDESGSIGKRYARMDEVGTPYCVTVDYETLEDNTVTVRERDSTKQERLAVPQLAEKLAGMLGPAD